MRTKLLRVMASALTIALLVSPAGVRAQPDRATPSAADGLVPAAEAPVPAQVTETTAPAPAAVTPVPAPRAEAPAPKHEAETLPLFKAEQLDQLLAPLALYPDTLLAQILIAATYPLEVVKADRWLQDPSHLNLQGDQLAGAIEAEAWDPSVKSLVPFPRILRLMDESSSGQNSWAMPSWRSKQTSWVRSNVFVMKPKLQGRSGQTLSRG